MTTEPAEPTGDSLGLPEAGDFGFKVSLNPGEQYNFSTPVFGGMRFDIKNSDEEGSLLIAALVGTKVFFNGKIRPNGKIFECIRWNGKSTFSITSRRPC